MSNNKEENIPNVDCENIKEELEKSWKETESTFVLKKIADEGVYVYIKKPEYCNSDEEKEVLYCPKCLHEKCLYFLVFSGHEGNGRKKMKCPNCKNEFLTNATTMSLPTAAYKNTP